MRKTPNHLIPRSDRDILGDDNSNNSFSSTNVVANADGSLIERIEYIQTCVGGLSGQLRFQQSASNVVEDDSYAQFEITLMDINSGAITSANINISAITVELAKSTGGGAFSAVGITQPTFSKADGRVYCSNRFLAAEWSVGDTYRLTVNNIIVTFGTEYAYVPMMVWCNIITDIIDIDTVVDAIKVETDRIQNSALTVGMVSSSLASYVAGNNGGLGTTLPAGTSLYDSTKVIRSVAIDGTTTPVANTLSDILHKDGSYTFDNTTDSLEAISDKVTDVNSDLGNFSGQTNLQSVLAVLGVPDVAGKDLYTCLITDRLDNATYGLSAIETLVDDIETELAKVPKSDSNVTWNATALGSINAEVDTALNTIVPAAPTAGSLNDILSKASGGNTFDKATDSLEAISDAVSSGTQLVTATGNGTTGTVVASAYTQADDYWNGCLLVALTGNNAGQARIVSDFTSGTFTVVPAFGTATATSETYSLISGMSLYDYVKNISSIGVTTAPVANTLADTLHKDGNFSYDNTTDSLEAISDKVSLIPVSTAPGVAQITSTTEDLNQAAASYDLLTGTTQKVLLESLLIKMPTGAAGGALTSISIQTDDATPGVIISSADGAVANLTSEAEISWTGAMLINVGTKIQLTIAGGAHGSEYITTVIAKYRAVVAGGTLV